MPTVKDITPLLPEICAQIKKLDGVKAVYLWGSVNSHIDDPTYVCKDIDVIAQTIFDSGDLLAIDNGKYSPLRMNPSDLEDEGFDPKAVSFTKQFIAMQHNVDHWAISKDKKLLHWGAIPETHLEWQDLHTEAEVVAEKRTGIKRLKLASCSDDKRKEWRHIFDHYVYEQIASKSSGWFASDDCVDNILKNARLMEGQ